MKKRVTWRLATDKSARPTVLVIDDDEDIRTAVRDILEDQGFTVEGAANGREALDMLLREELNPTLILLDLTMPEMDGWTFRQEQQKVHRLAQIPVVLFSGHRGAERAAQFLKVAALMNKPLRLEGLVTLVEQLSHRGKPN